MKSSVRFAEPVNGCRAKLTKIGTVTTTESEEHRITYETASWYTAVEVPPGTYDVELHEGLGSRWVMVRYHGVITDEHFVNRVFGHTSLVEPRHIGEERSCTAQLSPYIAAEHFAASEGWELAEDWSLSATQHVDDYRNRRFALWALVDPDGNARH